MENVLQDGLKKKKKESNLACGLPFGVTSSKWIDIKGYVEKCIQGYVLLLQEQMVFLK